MFKEIVKLHLECLSVILDRVQGAVESARVALAITEEKHNDNK